MAELKIIPVSEIHENPVNPREELDPKTPEELSALLNEEEMHNLIESVKASGILQPLSVFHGSYDKDGNFDETNGYTLTMGHRRLFAAKQAGLSSVPCIVTTRLSDTDSLLVALQENGHRKNLSSRQQSVAMNQIVLSGLSVDDLAKKSGYCKSTVQKRLEIAKLDQSLLAKAERKNGTISLGDLDQLSEIESVDTRNTLIKSIGTKNFQSELEKAKRKEEFERCKKQWLDLLPTFAEKIERTNDIWKKYTTVKYCYIYAYKELTVPEDVSSVKYYYSETENEVTLYKERVEQTLSKIEICREEIKKSVQEKMLQIEEMKDVEKRVMLSFVKDLNAEKYVKEISKEVSTIFDDTYTSSNWMHFSHDTFIELSGKEDDEDVSDIDPARRLLFYVVSYYSYTNMIPTKWNIDVQSYAPTGYCSDDARKLYEFLETVGYEISDACKSLLEETAPVFKEVDALIIEGKAKIAKLEKEEQELKEAA